MMTIIPDLFEEIHAEMLQLLQELERPKLKNIFISNQDEIHLSLSDHYLFLYSNPTSQLPTHYCKLTFSVKFEVIYQSVFVN
jgi:hypothetical protein